MRISDWSSDVCSSGLDMDAIPQSNVTGYPSQYARAVEGRWCRRVGPVSGLADFGASQVVLKPGASSSQRHWHEDEDEMVIMLSGEAILVDDNEIGRASCRERACQYG